MTFGDGTSVICASQEVPRDRMFYEQYFRISGDESATLLSASTTAQGLIVDDYFVVVDPPVAIGVVDAPLAPEAEALLRPLRGAAIPPNAAAFVVTEVSYPGAGEATAVDLTLAYEVGGVVFEAVFENTFAIGTC